MRQAVRGTHGAVAAGSEYATEAGMRTFYRGGNAVDAGVASMFAASVTEFSHFGMGGEAPILIRTKAGKVFSIAGVGTMPKKATAELFRTRPLKIGELFETEPGGLKDIIPVAGIMPALVPGMVDAGLVALRDFGTKSFGEMIEPAIELSDGFAIDEMRSNVIAGSRQFFQLWPTSKAHWMPNGQIPRVGDIFRQPDLEHTLRAMAEAERKALAAGASRQSAIDAVRDYFYRGDVARKIDAFMKANGGLLRYEDMEAFHLEPEEPVMGTYHGYKVYKPGFWSQGPAMIETLNIMEAFDGRRSPINSAEYIHRAGGSVEAGLCRRDTYYGDPKFNHIPDILLVERIWRGTPPADHRKSVAGFYSGQDQRKNRPSSYRESDGAYQDR